MIDYVADPIELFKQFSDDEPFRRGLSDLIFAATYNRVGAAVGASKKMAI